MNLIERRGFRLSMSLGALVCVAMMGFNSFTRIREFTADSMNYVDVARNFASGRGISQTSLGFALAEFAPDDPIPAPWTGHAPGFSILIALAGSVSGMPFEDIILVLPILFLGVLLVAASLLAKDCYGGPTAWLVLGVLLNYYPLRHVSAVGWSETTATAFVFCTLWLVARLYRGHDGLALPLLIGLSAGAAFGVRYPMCVIVAVAGVAILARRQARGLRDAAWFGAGVLCTAGPVLARNVAVEGVAGTAWNPYYTPVATNLAAALQALTEYYQPYYLETPPRVLELALLGAALAAAALVLIRRGRFAATLAGVILRRDGPLWIGLWAAAYLAFIITMRSITWFDGIDDRLTMPAGIGLAMLATALAVKTWRPKAHTAGLVAAALLIAALGRETWFAASRSPVPREMPQTPRLAWIAANTTGRDLIIGDYTIDLPFYFERRPSITFEHYPYTQHLTADRVRAYLQHHCSEYDRAYLIVRTWFPKHRLKWEPAFGPLIADLVLGDGALHPDYELLATLEDSSVFRITIPACAGPRVSSAW